MKTYMYDEAPLKVFGVPFFEQTKRLERLPESVREQVPSLSQLGRRVTGARIAFRTNSKTFSVSVEHEKMGLDVGISPYQGQSAMVFIGDRQTSRYAGLVHPNSLQTTSMTATFSKSEEMEDILIYLPRNPVVWSVKIEVEDDAQVLPPTPYRYQKPIVYYGSSITECGCGMVSNGYNSLISRWLDVDFYNLGFSGSAKGEAALAQYINTIEKSIFVYDYDFNAPDVEHLEKTHEAFFKMIREHDPELPIIILTRPNFLKGEEDAKRCAAIRKTYEHAIAAEDQNVYFVDGASYFTEELRPLCTIDTIHPTDLGFYHMAKTICPLVERILQSL